MNHRFQKLPSHIRFLEKRVCVANPMHATSGGGGRQGRGARALVRASREAATRPSLPAGLGLDGRGRSAPDLIKIQLDIANQARWDRTPKGRDALAAR
jgi:hypothetical protein